MCIRLCIKLAVAGFLTVAAAGAVNAIQLTPVVDPTATMPIPADFVQRTKTVRSARFLLPELLRQFNDKLFADVVQRAIERTGSEVEHILTWAPDSGVLVAIDIQTEKVPAPGSTAKSLLGQGARVVGAGRNYAAVMARELAIPQQLEAAPLPNWQRSAVESRFLWYTKTTDGYQASGYPYLMVVRDAGALNENQKLKKALDDADSRTLTLSMARTATRIVRDAKARQRIRDLETSAVQTLAKLDEINERLRRALEEAERIGAVIDTLAKLSAVLELGAQIEMARSAIGPDTPTGVLQAKSNAELSDELSRAHLRGQDVVRGLEQTQTEVRDNFIIQKNQIVLELSKQNAPIRRIP